MVRDKIGRKVRFTVTVKAMVSANVEVRVRVVVRTNAMENVAWQ